MTSRPSSTSSKSIQKSLLKAVQMRSPPPSLQIGQSREERLQEELKVALATRDAALFELSDVLQHNVALLKRLRERGGGLDDTQPPASTRREPATYAEDLLQRRQAIAAATSTAPSSLSDSASTPLFYPPAVPVGPEGDEADMLTKAVGLSLDRLRELRWKELLLQADISDFTGLTPHSKSLYESLGKLAKTLPENHPMTVKVMALASVAEEMAATRAELAMASEHLSFLRARKERNKVRGAHAVWSEVSSLGATVPRHRSPSPNLSPLGGRPGSTFAKSPRPDPATAATLTSPARAMSPTPRASFARVRARSGTRSRDVGLMGSSTVLGGSGGGRGGGDTGGEDTRGPSPTRLKAEQQWMEFVRQFEKVGGGATQQQ